MNYLHKTTAITFIGYIDITSHPQSVTVAEGDMLTLSVTADGPGKNMFKYQWEKRHSTSLPDTVSGKKSSMLTIRSVKPSDGGSYQCSVMNQWGNMTKSNEAAVRVLCKSHFDIMLLNYKGVGIMC